MARCLYIERALFVVGEPDDGKSTQLRSMFVDRRFGTDGKIPGSKKIRETYWLSHSRRLYLRLTSPHEIGESPHQFFRKIRQKTRCGRWVVVSPLQREAGNRMPGLTDTVQRFVNEFSPERVRVCFLSPNQSGETDAIRIQPFIEALWKIEGVECVVLDATSRSKNGHIYADFLDFA